ncbi:beta-ketoacyl-ACP synthase [Gammaproteobacteria bacterium AH-315-M22]|nr:beta-ketoacyl-ACP synthase [Gammaproteobacteria bacterium AH-315-M22]
MHKNSHIKGQQRVVITGGGTISALGNNWQDVSQSLKSQRNAVCFMEDWQQYSEMNTRLAAPVLDFSLPEHYSIKQKRRMGRVAQMAVRASELALEQAGLLGDEVLGSGQTGVAYGSATGSSNAALEFFSLLENQSMARINSSTYLRMMSHTAAINISVYFGTQGRMYTTSSACTAGSQGIGFAYEAICSGQQQVMIAGGAEELCPTQAAVFDTIFAASTANATPEQTPRPYDQQRDGLVLGEGACTLILESYDHAQARGADILAEVIGYATNTDGYHLVQPRQATMAKVMDLCLKNANISASEVDYVAAHGTATEQGDIAESLATEQVLGASTPVSALKSYTGHTLGMCGAFEAWASIMMMREEWFVPTLNLHNIDPRCGDLDYIRDECRGISAQIIMSNNFAFGGVNTSLLFRYI